MKNKMEDLEEIKKEVRTSDKKQFKTQKRLQNYTKIKKVYHQKRKNCFRKQWRL